MKCQTQTSTMLLSGCSEARICCKVTGQKAFRSACCVMGDPVLWFLICTSILQSMLHNLSILQWYQRTKEATDELGQRIIIYKLQKLFVDWLNVLYEMPTLLASEVRCPFGITIIEQELNKRKNKTIQFSLFFSNTMRLYLGWKTQNFQLQCNSGSGWKILCSLGVRGHIAVLCNTSLSKQHW